MKEFGYGPPLVLLPGIQGRWEWMAPTVHALARSFRVLTSSLPGEPGSLVPHDRAAGFGMFLDLVDRMLDRVGVERAVVCGVSYGGLISAAYAAARPERVQKLVLASAPGPRWKPDARVRGYLQKPLASVPGFAIGAIGRLYPEVVSVFPAWGSRSAFLARHLTRVLTAGVSPRRMAERIELAGTVDFVAACRRISAPTLVIAGEPHLDRVVPVGGMSDYVTLIPDARFTTLAGCGHIGMVTRADAFAALVAEFVRNGVATPVRAPENAS